MIGLYSNDRFGFIKQAQEFDTMFAGVAGKLINYVSINTAFSPWLVARAAKLLEWYNSNEYTDFNKQLV